MAPRVKPGPAGLALALVLALVLLGHWTGLDWLHTQMRAIRPLTPAADPLFTRTIAPAPVLAPAQAPRPRPRPQPVRPETLRAATISGDAGAAAASADLVEPPEEAGLPWSAAPAPPAPDAEPATARASDASPPAPVASSDAGDTWPADTRVSYRMTGYVRGDLHGSGRVQWQRALDRYQVRVDLFAALVFRVSMISQGKVTDDGLVPGAYKEQLPGRQQGIFFDADTLRFQDGSRQPKPGAVQDTASQFVELSRRFSTGREVLEVGGEVRVWLARPFGMALWTYDVVAQDTLDTPVLGPIQAFHLRPRPVANPRGVITAEMWFAPALQHLPVRVRISLGSDNFVDLLVERIEQGEAASPQASGTAARP